MATEFEFWIFVNFPKMPTHFADLSLIASSADCFRVDETWTISSPSCDLYGREINYYSIVPKLFAVLGISLNSVTMVGWLFVMMFYGTLYLIILTQLQFSRLDFFIVTIFIASPPFFLLLERGNSDILMFALIMTGFVFRNVKKGLISLIMFSLSLLIKPFSLCILLYLGLSRNVKGIYALVFLAASVGVLSAVREDLPIMYGRTYQILDLSFGPRQIFLISQLLFNNEFMPPKMQLIYVLTVITLVVLTLIVGGKKIQSIPLVCRESDLLLFSSVLFVGVFTMGNSYDTRLWTLLPFIFWLLKNRTYWLALFLSFTMHLSFLSHPFDLVLDLLLYPIVGFMGSIIWINVTTRIKELHSLRSTNSRV